MVGSVLEELLLDVFGRCAVDGCEVTDEQVQVSVLPVGAAERIRGAEFGRSFG